MKIKKALCLSIADTTRCVLILIGALMVCLILMHLGESDIYSPLIFELAVFLTAR